MRRGWMRGGWIVLAGFGAGGGLLAGCGQDEAGSEQPADTAETADSNERAANRTLASNDRQALGPAGGAGDRVIRRIEAGEWTLRLSRAAGGGDEQEVEIVRGGNTYWSRFGDGFDVDPAELASGADSGGFRQGSDLTGDGRADLIVRERRPGEADLFLVLTPGDPVDVTAQLEARGEGVGFADLDGDGTLEFITRDPAFGEASPEVVLSFRDGAYEPSPAHMAAPEPDRLDLERRIERVILDDSWESGEPPAALSEEAVRLIYSGHEDLAWRFIEWAWPEGMEGRERFAESLRADLEASPYSAQFGR